MEITFPRMKRSKLPSFIENSQTIGMEKQRKSPETLPKLVHCNPRLFKKNLIITDCLPLAPLVKNQAIYKTYLFPKQTSFNASNY